MSELIRRCIMYAEYWSKTGDETARDRALFWYVAAVAGKDMALKQDKKFAEFRKVRDTLMRNFELCGIPADKAREMTREIMK